jgi:hypothetical protein
MAQPKGRIMTAAWDDFLRHAADDQQADEAAARQRQTKPNGHAVGDDLPDIVDAGEDEPIPPRQWLLGTTFCRGFLSSILSPGGTGKTALRIAQAISVATNRPLTGEHVHHRSRVLYVTLEDSMDELRRRVRAARIHHGVTPEELSGWLFLWAPGRDSKIAQMESGHIVPGTLEAQLRAIIVAKQIDVVICDPFIKSYGGAIDENSNSQIDAVCDILVRLAIELNFAPDVLHHDAKGTREAGDSNRGRGASSLRDAGRLGHTLTVMTPDEGKAFGIPENERRLYVRLDPAKVNLIPATEARWFQLVGTKIENPTADYPSGDTVQTVARWAPPETWAGLSNLALNAALDDIEAGMPDGRRYSAANSAKDVAAWRAVQKHCPNKTEPQCREIIKTWLDNGVVYSETYQNPITRNDAKGLRVNDVNRPS